MKVLKDPAGVLHELYERFDKANGEEMEVTNMKHKTIVDFINSLAATAKEERNQTTDVVTALYYAGKIDGFETAASVCNFPNLIYPVGDKMLTDMKAAAEKHRVNAEKLDTEASRKIAVWYRGKSNAYSVVLSYLQKYDKKR